MTDQPADTPATTKKPPTKLLVLAGAAVALMCARDRDRLRRPYSSIIMSQ